MKQVGCPWLNCARCCLAAPCRAGHACDRLRGHAVGIHGSGRQRMRIGAGGFPGNCQQRSDGQQQRPPEFPEPAAVCQRAAARGSGVRRPTCVDVAVQMLVLVDVQLLGACGRIVFCQSGTSMHTQSGEATRRTDGRAGSSGWDRRRRQAAAVRPPANCGPAHHCAGRQGASQGSGDCCSTRRAGSGRNNRGASTAPPSSGPSSRPAIAAGLPRFETGELGAPAQRHCISLLQSWRVVARNALAPAALATQFTHPPHHLVGHGQRGASLSRPALGAASGRKAPAKARGRPAHGAAPLAGLSAPQLPSGSMAAQA